MNLSTPQNATHLHIHGTGNTININSGSGQQCIEVKEAPEHDSVVNVAPQAHEVPQARKESQAHGKPQTREESGNTDRSLPTYERDIQQQDSSVASSKSHDGYYLRNDGTDDRNLEDQTSSSDGYDDDSDSR